MSMHHPSSPEAPRRASALLPAQLAVTAAVLLACTVLPRADGPALLVPITRSAAKTGMLWVRDHRGAVVGRGVIPGSLVVRGVPAGLALRAMTSGLLLLAAPARLCEPAAGLQ